VGRAEGNRSKGKEKKKLNGEIGKEHVRKHSKLGDGVNYQTPPMRELLDMDSLLPAAAKKGLKKENIRSSTQRGEYDRGANPLSGKFTD